MQNSPIRLGSIDLSDFEIPQSVRFGGRQRLAVHALAGGRRIVERLGPDDDDIQFQGTFSGPTAETRVRAFDNLRLSGEIVSLTWESFTRQVIVKRFIASYVSPWWIHYQISCVVVHQTRTTSSTSTSLAAMLSTDLNFAISMTPISGISISSLQAAISNRNALTPGTADQAQAIAEVSLVSGQIAGQIDKQSTAISVLFPLNSNSVDMSQSYISRVDCAGSLAAAASLRGFVGRIGANIAGSNP